MTQSLRTCTVLIWTNGTVHRYAVLAGKMSGRGFNAKFDSSTAMLVWSGDCTEAPSRGLYRSFTKRFATATFPAVPWQV